MIKIISKLLSTNNITQRDISAKIGCCHSNIHQYLVKGKKLTPKATIKILHGMKEIAKEREISYIKLQMELNKLLMDMSKSNGISDV